MIILRKHVTLEQRDYASIEKEVRKLKDKKNYKNSYQRVLDLDKELDKINIDRIKNEKEVTDIKPFKNKKVQNKLLRKAKELNARVFRDNYDSLLENPYSPKGPQVIDTLEGNSIHKEIRKGGKEMIDNISSTISDEKDRREWRKIYGDSSRYHIRLPKEYGNDALAHELGHIKNKNSDKYVQKDNRTKKQQLEEETRANKKAIKMLRSAGSTKSEINQSKSNLSKNTKKHKLDLKEDSILNEQRKIKNNLLEKVNTKIRKSNEGKENPKSEYKDFKELRKDFGKDKLKGVK